MISTWRFVPIYLLLLVAAFFTDFRQEVSVPVNKPLTMIPLRQAGWHLAGQSYFDAKILAVLKPTDYLSRVYTDEEGNSVVLYLGYHGGGPGVGPIHSPKHCLPGSGWQLMNNQKITLTVGGQPVHLVEAVYQNGESRQLFVYWYQMMGETLDNEYALKYTEVKNSILHNRRDAAFIRLAINIKGDQEKTRIIGERFVKAFYASISEVLPH